MPVDRPGKVYFCPSPIGNLGDMTLRSLEALKEADTIACEDTRHSGRLLKHFGITKPLISYHDHNEKSRTQDILERVRGGEVIALLTDAGMPGVSDPGGVLLGALVEEGLPYEVLPGPTAVTTAVVQANLAQGRYIFWGFLPPKENDRVKALEGLKEAPLPLVFYEAPHRLQACLKSLREVLGQREVVICRELTKKFEEVIRTDLDTALQDPDLIRLQGEFVLVVNRPQEEEAPQVDIQAALRAYLDQGMKKSQAVKHVAQDHDLPKNQVYKESLEIE